MDLGHLSPNTKNRERFRQSKSFMEYDNRRKFLNSSNSFETFSNQESRSLQRYEILKNFRKIQQIMRSSYKYIEEKQNDIKRKETADPMFDKR